MISLGDKISGLRTKLVFSLLSVAITVLIIFGIVSYNIMHDAALNQSASLFSQYTINDAAEISEKLEFNYDPKNIQHVLKMEEEEDHWAVVIDKNTREIIAQNGAIARYFPKLNIPNKELVKSAVGNMGYMQIQGETYYWAIANLHNPEYQVYSLQQQVVPIAFSMSSLYKRLILTGVIVIWLAVWGGMILSTLISEKIEKQSRKIIHQALHDPLTNLANRSKIMDQINKLINSGSQESRRFGVLIMDLDHFKEINDTLGHKIGDDLLINVAGRLIDVVGEAGTVARLGGDEFAFLLPDADVAKSNRYAENIIQSFNEPFIFEDLQIEVRTSMGLAVFPENGEDVESLMRHAEVAMYQAKRKHLEIEHYEPKSDPHTLRRLILMSDARHAIENGEFVIYYQPKVSMPDGKLLGFEALSRWDHKHLGRIQPDEFIPLLEQSGLIRPLTDWVLKQSCDQLQVWSKLGWSVCISVNLSVHSLQDLDFPVRLAEILRSFEVSPNSIELEITESAIMLDPAHSINILRRLQKLGVKLSIDDFGTGYSSLSYLKMMPVGELKIDKSFVMDMENDRSDELIVRSIVDLGHNFGCQVVAEGVENKTVLQMLERMGCDVAQGYYLGKPMEVSKISEWMEKWQPQDFFALNTEQDINKSTG